MSKPNKKSTIVQPNQNNNTVLDIPSQNLIDGDMDAESDL